MFTENNLFEWEEIPARIRVQGTYTLEQLKALLLDEENGLPALGFPVRIENDQIQSGSIFNRQYTDCIVIKNKEHLYDYFFFVISARHVGNFTGFEIWRAGESTLSYQQNKKEARKNSSSLFQNMVGALTKTDTQGLENENMYYGIVADKLRQIFGV